jgi:hypothetical protein
MKNTLCVKKHTYEGTKAFFSGWKPVFFLIFVDFIAPGSEIHIIGFQTVFPTGRLFGA